MLALGDDVPGVIAVGPSAMGVIAFGQNARGVFAFGQLATGVFAFGQVATGVVAVGQLARGGIAIGQGALGLVAVGQIAVGLLWAVGLGIGGTAGPGLVYGLFGRFRFRQIGDRLYELRAGIRRTRGRMRGIPQDAVPSFVSAADRRPFTVPLIVGRVLKSVGLVAIAVLWWVVAGQALATEVFGG